MTNNINYDVEVKQMNEIMKDVRTWGGVDHGGGGPLDILPEIAARMITPSDNPDDQVWPPPEQRIEAERVELIGAAPEDGDHSSGLELERGGAGKQYFDAFRANLSAIRVRERQSLDQQTALVLRAERVATIALSLGTLLTLAICLGVGWHRGARDSSRTKRPSKASQASPRPSRSEYATDERHRVSGSDP
jgi:hypothetical protein